MFRFTIRDLMWLMVAVGLGTGWWCEHQFVTRRSLRQRFEWQAERWETFCEEYRWSSTMNPHTHDAVDKLVAMGPDIIPFIFERWPAHINDPEILRERAPWYTVLERLTGKKLISDAEQGNFEFRISSRELERRWREWWEKERGLRFGIGPSLGGE